jgi:hypothetical protein
MQTPSPSPASPASAGAYTASPRVRALLGSLHATILEERLQSPPVPPGAVVLLAAHYTQHRHRDGAEYRTVRSYDDLGNEVWLQSGYEVDPSSTRRPWLWYGNEARVDTQGEIWLRSLPNHIVNDFGDLVPVPA